MMIILIGLIIVGLADVLQPEGNNSVGNNTTNNNSMVDFARVGADVKCNATGSVFSNEVVGDIMILAAQGFLSIQFVYEEKLMNTYDIVPLQAVGWEGIYGLMIISVLLVPLSYIDIGESI